MFGCGPTVVSSSTATSVGAEVDASGVTEPSPTSGGNGSLSESGDADSGEPTHAPPLALALASNSTCGVTPDRGVRCWGLPLDAEQPANAAPLLEIGASPATDLAGGGAVNCAIQLDGSLTCWGIGVWGQLGYGDLEPREVPPTGPVSIGGRAIAAEVLEFSCALLDTQQVRCWGLSGHGWLGHALGICTDCSGEPWCCIGDDEQPSDRPPVDIGAPAAALSVGINVACILTPDGRVRVWGGGWPGVLGLAMGDESIGDNEAPSAAPDVEVGGSATAVQCGGISCALLEGGSLTCWGRSNVGYGVDQPIGDDETPASMGPIELPGRVVQIDAFSGHVCAVLEGGALYCWGSNRYGQLGLGHQDPIGDDETPLAAGPVDIGGPAASVRVGEQHTCAVRTDGALLCWGHNDNGQLGYGHTETIGDDEPPASAGPVPWL
jgi:alpha-tubulin suppressor-like RCC1 family protein